MVFTDINDDGVILLSEAIMSQIRYDYLLSYFRKLNYIDTPKDKAMIEEIERSVQDCIPVKFAGIDPDKMIQELREQAKEIDDDVSKLIRHFWDDDYITIEQANALGIKDIQRCFRYARELGIRTMRTKTKGMHWIPIEWKIIREKDKRRKT